MNFRLVFRLAGKTLLVEAASMLLPLAVALLYREDPTPFFFGIGITAGVGFLLSLLRSDTRFHAREGFFSAGLIWLLVGLFGAIPFYICGHFDSYVDCFFECISGFTTTGSSILRAVEGLPRGILFWRSFTHWLGGMGILVLTIALLPSLGARTLHVMKAESPGPIISKLVPKASQSSKILYTIYFGLTVIMVVCLLLADMPLYDALVNSFATAGTGGFSVLNISIGGYGSPACEIIIGVFMILFSVNFALYFLILNGKVRQALKSDELRFFLLVVAVSVLLISFNINSMYPDYLTSLRHAFFQVSTIISTTGFSSVDFDLWPEFSRTLLVLLMLFGACAGSTGGGMKCSRILLLLRCTRRELHRIIHPNLVETVRLEGRTVDEDTLRSTLTFIGCYLAIILAGALVVSLDDVSFSVSFTSALTCVSNVGPGLDLVGPAGNFSTLSALSKGVLSACMVIGRLEIMPVLVLFSRGAWRRT